MGSKPSNKCKLGSSDYVRFIHAHRTSSRYRLFFQSHKPATCRAAIDSHGLLPRTACNDGECLTLGGPGHRQANRAAVEQSRPGKGERGGSIDRRHFQDRMSRCLQNQSPQRVQTYLQSRLWKKSSIYELRKQDHETRGHSK